MENITTNIDKYIVCHNGNDVIHLVLLKKGNKLVTGQEFIEEFSTIDEAKNRINDIAKDPTFFDSNFAEFN